MTQPTLLESDTMANPFQWTLAWHRHHTTALAALFVFPVRTQLLLFKTRLDVVGKQNFSIIQSTSFYPAMLLLNPYDYSIHINQIPSSWATDPGIDSLSSGSLEIDEIDTNDWNWWNPLMKWIQMMVSLPQSSFLHHSSHHDAASAGFQGIT